MAKEDLKVIVKYMCMHLKNAPIKREYLTQLGKGLFNNLVKNGYLNREGFLNG